MKRRLTALLVPLVLIMSGCTRGEPGPSTRADGPPPFADCAGLVAAPAAAGRTSATAPAAAGTARVAPAAAGLLATPAPAADAAPSLAGLTLPCFTGGASIDLGALRGPMVLNLWASWCAPCRKELPAFQRLADRTEGRLHVLGVDVRDDRASAQSLATDLGISFPTLYDPEEQLGARLSRQLLPVTLFLDGAGQVRYIHGTGALDDHDLAALVERHLGLAVPA